VSAPWSLADVPDQTGRTIIVTGPSPGGLGYFTSLELARRGARVVLAGRNPKKVAETADDIRREVPAAQLESLVLDLSSFASVREAASACEAFGPIDVLVNNAGVMAIPPSKTDDGLDLQLQTNFYGPFLFTGLVLPQLSASGHGLVVSISSVFHKLTRTVPPAPPRKQWAKWDTYFQTKLACLMFIYELDRRLRAAGLPVSAVAAHPGSSATQLQASSGSILAAATKALLQPADHGAWPVLEAVTGSLPGGTYVGPDGFLETRGRPEVVGSTKVSKDQAKQRALWAHAEQVTGIGYP
jgi:NAD(P)-dependent dehydrogenase (short-subunit alcohol dehydrogenase family)